MSTIELQNIQHKGDGRFRDQKLKNPEILQLTPFFEIGSGWNNQTENPDPKLLASLGLGLQWRISPSFRSAT